MTTSWGFRTGRRFARCSSACGKRLRRVSSRLAGDDLSSRVSPSVSNADLLREAVSPPAGGLSQLSCLGIHAGAPHSATGSRGVTEKRVYARRASRLRPSPSPHAQPPRSRSRRRGASPWSARPGASVPPSCGSPPRRSPSAWAASSTWRRARRSARPSARRRRSRPRRTGRAPTPSRRTTGAARPPRTATPGGGPRASRTWTARASSNPTGDEEPPVKDLRAKATEGRDKPPGRKP